MKYNHIIIDNSNLYWRSVSSVIKKVIEQDNEDAFYSLTIQDSLERIEQLKNIYGNDETIVYILNDNPFSKINERELIDSSYKHARKNKNIPIKRLLHPKDQLEQHFLPYPLPQKK